MGRRVFVVGVGMTKFEKPGKKEWDYPDMAKYTSIITFLHANHLLPEKQGSKHWPMLGFLILLFRVWLLDTSMEILLVDKEQYTK